MLDNIPNEMRTYPHWVMWRYEDRDGPKPTKVPYSPRSHKRADVSKPETWADYDTAVACLNSGQYSGIGFVLSEHDPYTMIDLDDVFSDTSGVRGEEAQRKAFELQKEVFNEFNSYSEFSPSGKGLHVIVKGQVPCGRRRSCIEVYSNVRFMTMTGNVHRNAPIAERHDLLQVLHKEMSKGKEAAVFYAGANEIKFSDEEVLKMAAEAANGEKFSDLFYEGNWQKYYPSQSEADFALVNIIAFYSENRWQVQNLFLRSKLAEREKSRAQYRIEYMLARCFDRMLPPVDIDGLQNLLEEYMQSRKQADIVKTQAEPVQVGELKPQKSIYSVPPGLTGEIAKFVYAQAPRPVAEIAIVAALGLMSGIIGRAYNVSGTGLNSYLLLLAPTGTGKEAIASGIEKLMSAVGVSVPTASEFIGPGEISSSPALIKQLAITPSCLSLVGEFGLYFRNMCAEHAPPHLVGLRRSLLDLFNKSGFGNVVRPMVYSDRDKNTRSVLSPAFTVVGESTPERFYDVLNESMISEGLLPRFTIIEYNGPRVENNENRGMVKPSDELVDKLATLCAFAMQLNSNNRVIDVALDDNADRMFRDFDKHCDANINTADREIRRHLWNRAHLRAMKLAAVLAVGNDPYHPTIDSEAATWAINLVVADVRNILGKFDAGEIGIDNDETKQLQTVVHNVRSYILSPFSEVEKYVNGMANLHSERIIPYSFLQRKLVSVAIFRKDKLGATNAIKRALKTLEERGDIQLVSRKDLSTKYKTSSVAYMISNPKAFDL
ncbi:DNA primase/helicase, phage-associated [Xanthomonas phage Suba]|uniref:DNA primase/helicase, phage-associated n=1 Tax=Xanthomonas phage Suba TaxID=2674975 RepID=A0A679KGJ7_9CAUD|nr:DNA primase/helicase, phage-associated [Xanthomonas phage Suba]CAA2409815.1 DNA primase/helicase, phage-associated [Xanthomonas phage Suba]